MGTNYYLRYKQCDHCGRYETAHLGKFSGGWRFLAAGLSTHIDINVFKNWENFRSFLLDNKDSVYDEYGQKADVKRLVKQIEDAYKDRIHSEGPSGRRMHHSGPIDVAHYDFC